MDPYEQVLNAVAHATGLDPLTVVGMVPLLVIALNLIGRAIPDDKTGPAGWLRTIAKIGGLYISNRVASGVSANSVVKVAAGLKPVAEVPALFDRLVDAPAPALELTEDLTPENQQPLFPGVQRGADGAFVSNKAKLESPIWTGLVALGLILYLSSCAVPL